MTSTSVGGQVEHAMPNDASIPTPSPAFKYLPSTLQHLLLLRPTLFLRSLTLFSIEASVNLLLWIVTLIVAAPSSSGNFASLALIAWTTGLRHGLDADHICAIDNATRRIVGVRTAGLHIHRRRWLSRFFFFWRKNIYDADDDRVQETSQKGVQPLTASQQAVFQRPLLVGFWFSLGHSTVVMVVTIAISVSLQVANNLEGFGGVGSVVGPAVSGSFLFLVAVGNSIMLGRAWKARKRLQREEKERQRALQSGRIAMDAENAEVGDIQSSPSPNDNSGRFMGLLTRMASPLLKAVTRPYHMWLVGALFGLGFDTASTIALLSVSASAGLTEGSNAKVVLLAFLFTAGMTWVDSCDSILMVWAYAPPGQGQAGGPGNKRWWTFFEEKRSEQQGSHSELGSEKNSNVQTPEGRDPEQKSDSRMVLDGEEEIGIISALSQSRVEPNAEALPSSVATEAASMKSRGDSPHIPLATLSDSAQSLSHLLTLLSIILAFTISIIVLMGLIASECSTCSRSLQLHQQPEIVPPLSEGGGERVDDGGLAGDWWAFWDGVNEQSGFIGAGIVAVFLVITLGWWLIRRMSRRRTKS